MPMVIRTLLALLAAVPAQEKPSPHPVKHRILKTWAGAQAEEDADGRGFLAEHKDLVDWLARNDYTGLIVGGFIDGRHGGEAAARELARYARARGIQLIVGLPVSGGFVSGLKDHPFGTPGESPLCLSRPENRDWLRRGSEWLLESFEVDGVSLESPSPCGCGDCRGGDLAVSVPIVSDVFARKRPGGLVTFSARPSEALLKSIPDPCIAQWAFREEDPRPSPSKPGWAHLSSGAPSDHRRRLRADSGLYRCFYPRIEEIRRLAAGVRRLKFDGFVVGESGNPKNPDAELAALAFIDFTGDPELTVEAFHRRHIPRLYGDQAADEVVRLFQAQSGIHERSVDFWKTYDGGWKESTRESAGQAAHALAMQLALARGAAAKATADGKRRLDVVIPILEEYRIVCEAAAEGPLDRKKLAERYETAGLPDDLYGYKKWKEDK